MKKIYLPLIAAAFAFASCGGEEKKSENKDTNGENEEEMEEVIEEEEPVDYSYVLPSIDTSALNTEAEILDAMQKVSKARKLDDSLASHVTGYTGYYTELTNLYTLVSSKATDYAMTLKGKAASEFSTKLFEVQK